MDIIRRCDSDPQRPGTAELRRALALMPAPMAASDTEDAAQLEAIVHTTLRPAVLVQDGRAVAWPAEWAHLTAHADAIAFAAERTGRVELEGNPALDWVGTGFVIDDRLVATNRHVLEEFAFHDSRHGWQIRDGMQARLDFAEEVGGQVSREVAVTGIWGVHDTFDLAVLQMGPGCPSPMSFASTAAVSGEEVLTIGYPAFDSRRNDAAAMQQIFRGIYNVKRLLPGLIIEPPESPWLLRHDCSTLGGNSGSPVLRPAKAEVVGVHFRGLYLRWNEAISPVARG
ncbi:MAG TPA: serine protease [Roseococcus sp.]|nr:serine protease [Roseococcus sp.]